MDIMKILACFVGTAYLATVIDYCAKLWQSREIKETNEGPYFYITKEL